MHESVSLAGIPFDILAVDRLACNGHSFCMVTGQVCCCCHVWLPRFAISPKLIQGTASRAFNYLTDLSDYSVNGSFRGILTGTRLFESPGRYTPPTNAQRCPGSQVSGAP